MPLAKVKKIELVAISNHKEKILDVLQEMSAMEITDLNNEEEFERIKELQKTELTFANLCFAIESLSPYAKKKGLFDQPETLSSSEVQKKLQEFDLENIVAQCSEIENSMNGAKNKINICNNELENLEPWKKLTIKLSNLEGSASTTILTGNVPAISFSSLTSAIQEISNLTEIVKVDENSRNTFFYLIFDKKISEDIKKCLAEHKFAENELPKTNQLVSERYEKIESEKKEEERTIKENESKLAKLAKNMENLELAHDWFAWQVEKLQTERGLANTKSSFIIKGWVQEQNLPRIEEELSKISSEWTLREIAPEEGENPPVVIQNKSFMSPFEAVSNIYGLPKASELDPTPFLAIFFILFFGLALTDAGYGIVMFIVMALILKYFKLAAGIKNLVKLLMYAGAATFVIGMVFGGWFGLTADQVPSFLTYTTASGETMFLLQRIDAIKSPLTVLILSLILGYIQVLTGVTIKFVHDFRNYSRKEAILGTGTWILMLTGIGVFIAGSALSLSFLAEAGKWWVIGATAILILTQGRENKNIIAKLLSGILSLYGLVGYTSDILSYSRLLALGLATSIIGLAVNIVADLASGIPYIGWLFVITIFIGGHIFNLLINALGSFIHSGRLQFVEFFTKFMEGGGREFKPFSKKAKYIFLNNNNS
jgi:V/A-type H+/Na+-transporting ATPase subunit I